MLLDSSSFTRGLNAAMRQADVFRGKLVAVGGAVAKMGLAGAAVGAVALAAGMRKAVAEAAKLQGMRAEFETMLGSAKAAGDLVEQIRGLAAATPFGTSGLTGNVKTMLAFGVAADAAMNYIRMLGDVAGSSQERLNSLALAFSQVFAGGKLTGGDLLQFINAGFNPLQEMARTSGRSMAELRKEMERGAISAEMVAKAFETATSKGGRFFGNMERQSKTWNGMMSSLRDSIDGTFAAFGQPLIENFTPTLQKVLSMMNSVQAISPQLARALSADISSIFQSTSISAAMADMGGRLVKVMAAAARAVAQALAGALLNGFAEPLAELQARMQVLVAMIKGKRAMTAEELGERAEVGRKIAKEEAALKTAPASTSGFETVAGFAFGDANENSREAIQYRLSRLRKRKGELDQRAAEADLLDKDAIKADILSSGGPKAWFGGDPVSGNELMTGALASISEAAKAGLPRTGSMLSSIIPRIAAGTFQMPTQQSFAASPAALPAQGMMMTPASVGEGEDGLALGSRADAWEGHIRRTRSTLGPQGLRLGAVRTAKDIASTSRGIWRGSNNRENSPSKLWKGSASESSAAMRSAVGSSSGGNLMETVGKLDARLEKIEASVGRIVTGD